MGKRICFTGHRPEKISEFYDENSEMMQNVKLELTNAIADAIEKGYDTFYSGVAPGIDIIASEIVLSFRNQHPHIRHVSVIPFESQSEKWELEWQQRYNKVLANSDEKLVLSFKYYRGCYYARNKFMVENSQCVIAVYKILQGGTGQTVRFAMKNEVPVIHIRL